MGNDFRLYRSMQIIYSYTALCTMKDCLLFLFPIKGAFQSYPASILFQAGICIQIHSISVNSFDGGHFQIMRCIIFDPSGIIDTFIQQCSSTCRIQIIQIRSGKICQRTKTCINTDNLSDCTVFNCFPDFIIQWNKSCFKCLHAQHTSLPGYRYDLINFFFTQTKRLFT